MTTGKINVGTIEYSMTLNNIKHPLDIIEKETHLGITVDTKLSFDDQVNQVVNKATKTTKIILITFQCLDKDTFVQLYNMMVRMHIDYAIAVCYPQKH